MISKNSLEQDLKNSNMALYRGSSTIIKAMRIGIIPIYYKVEDEFDIDIIEDELSWNIKTDTPLDMFNKIKKITRDKKNLLISQKKSIEFSNNYFSNFNEHEFKKILLDKKF